MPTALTRRTLIAYNGYDSGLGNRVRVVLGAKSLADLEHRRFAYVWPTGRLFGPRFDELWDFHATTVPRSVSRLLAKRFPYRNETLDWITERSRTEWLWQVRTGSPINLPPDARPWQEDLRALRPVAEVADAVTRFFDARLRGQPYIGVMIRANAMAHDKTRSASPVSWFVERMLALQRQLPGTRFFVSCDDADVQQRVLREVPDCCAQEDKGGYNSTDGVRAAVADLYLLAASGYLIGPHWSSFVHLAEHLAGDRLGFETAATGPRQPERYRDHGVVLDPLVPSERTGGR